MNGAIREKTSLLRYTTLLKVSWELLINQACIKFIPEFI